MIDKLQKIEIMARVIAYNIDRLIRIENGIVLVFIMIMGISY